MKTNFCYDNGVTKLSPNKSPLIQNITVLINFILIKYDKKFNFHSNLDHKSIKGNKKYQRVIVSLIHNYWI